MIASHELSDHDKAAYHARRCALAALYLPGLDRAVSPHRSGARQVLRELLLNPCEVGELSRTLDQAGNWEAALCLSQSSLLSQAEKLVISTRVLTLACHNYPALWSHLTSPPPALWMEGDLPRVPAIGVVGSREPPSESAALAREVAIEALRLGYWVVSGGAPGCDWEAGLAAGGQLVELLPCGIGRRWGMGSGCRLSAREPQEVFSTSAAMERNGLIYAFGPGAVVCHARFKAGGAWIGATEALRRRTGHLLIWEDRESLASRALIALGGTPLAKADQLEDALFHDPRRHSLFPPA